MSNLFKQYNTVVPQKDVRVIDYNPMVEEKIAELVRRQNSEGEPMDGFRELSLLAGEVQAPKEDPAETVRRQLEEAEETLNRAKGEAKTLVEEAKAQAEELRQKAVEEGQKEGYDAGCLQAKGDLEQEYGQRKEELERLVADRQAEYNRQLKDLEPRLLEAILAVVEKVFHVKFDDRKEILIYLIGNALAGIDGCREFCIRVCKEDKEFLETHKEEIIARIGRDITLDITADLTMEENECIIETDTGIFDCGTNVQLKNLIKDLRALSL